MTHFHQLLSYIKYWLHQENQHSLHAPFVYNLYKKTVTNHSTKKAYADIELVRKHFHTSKRRISVSDYGSGSHIEKTPERHLSKIASKGTTKAKYAQFLDRLIDHLEAAAILELGTSLGITSLYLSIENKRTLTTFEGAPSLVTIAQAVFEENGRTNIKIIDGNIDNTLPLHLKNNKSVDFVFIDANHTYTATLRYFKLLLQAKHKDTCFVFDDIHLTPKMERAWAEIKSHHEVTLSIDLFQIGIVFFNPMLRKQHYTLTY